MSSKRFEGNSQNEEVLDPLVNGGALPKVLKKDGNTRIDYGSVEEDAIGPLAKGNRGSSLRQVLAALFGSLGIVNTGMMFGFSAVTIPQLTQPDSLIQITDVEASWIASLSSVTTPIGCVVSGYLLDAFGRKRTIIVTMTPMIVGWFLISSAYNVYMIYAGRLFVGLGAGMMESPARVYTGEVSQPHLRGMLAAVASVGMSFGVMLQYVGGSFLQWNQLALLSGMVPTVGFISAFFLPESPPWLLIHGHTEAARAALNRLRGSSCDIDTEFKDLIKFSERAKQRRMSRPNTLHAVVHPTATRPFFILAIFFFVYQFSGISPLTFYAVQIIKDSGAQLDPNLATVVLGVVRLVFTVLACILLRRCGRRPLTFFSTIVCSLAMYGLGFYVYMGQRWEAEGATPVATWFPPLVIYIFMAACTMGLSTLPWVMIGELYPAKVRGILGGMTTFVGHSFVFLSVKTFPYLESVSAYGTFMLYATVSFLGTIYLYVYLPETKGRTLHEIEDFFSGKIKSLRPAKVVANNNNQTT